ncbi:MAG: dihydrofolate reductase [Bdellovibrionales bacterium]|nr:dihydrofolate reductase [Bdellovibrionales bacterium]
MKLIYSHICAAAENNTIGLKGQLPWNIPEDLRFFKEKTLNKALIMGRKTFASLGSPLPFRLHIVITRNRSQLNIVNANYVFLCLDELSQISNEEMKGLTAIKKILPVVFCSSIEKAMKLFSREEMQQRYGQEIFISGGGEVYKQTLPQVYRIYLTRIHRNYEGDAFYPEIPEGEFQEIERRDCEGNPSYSFITYERKKDTL